MIGTAKAGLDISITASVAPMFTPSSKIARMSRDSGVVWTDGRTSPATWYSIVPTRTVVRAARFNSDSARNAVVVFPFVPVIPIAASFRSTTWPSATGPPHGR